MRKGHLDDSLQAHQYLADVAEAESWLKEKEPFVTSDDYGKDEDSAQVNSSNTLRICNPCIYFGAPELFVCTSEHNEWYIAFL